jgi:hypothetical protein
MLSHWKGDSFLSGRGDYFYSSMSYTSPVYLQKITELAAARFVYRKIITKEVTLGARFEGFYYFEQSLFDYSYSLYILFNLDRQIFKRL